MRIKIIFLWLGFLALSIPVAVNAGEAQQGQPKVGHVSPHKAVASHAEKKKPTGLIADGTE